MESVHEERKRKDDYLRAERIRLGILPPPARERAQQAIERAVEALVDDDKDAAADAEIAYQRVFDNALGRVSDELKAALEAGSQDRKALEQHLAAKEIERQRIHELWMAELRHQAELRAEEQEIELILTFDD